MNKILLGCFLTVLSLFLWHIESASAKCVTLPNQVLSYGDRDSEVSSAVRDVQSYLASIGFLASSPTGYYGVNTRSAVKKYQSSNGIKATGQVGPLTRASIQSKTCIASQTSTVSGTSLNVSNGVTNSNVVSNTNSSVSTAETLVSSPSADSVWKSGEKRMIIWPNTTEAIYDVLIEDKNGVGEGYILSNTTRSSYEWEVGTIYTGSNASSQVLSPGVYKIHLRPQRANGNTVKDMYSGLFTVKGKDIQIDSIYPPSVPKDGKTSVSLYGSGFDTSTRVRLGDTVYGYQIYPSYISSDGRSLVFTIPNYLNINSGYHGVSAFNTYASGATSTPSNSVYITVTQ